MALVALDLSCLEIQPETGVERYARRLAETLPKAAEDIEFVLLTRPGRPAPVVLGHARVETVPSLLPRAGWRETAVPAALNRLGASILHAPMAAIPMRCAVPRIATIFDVPNFGEPGHEGKLSRHRLRLLHSLRSAERLIVPTAAVRDALLKLKPGIEDRIRVIPLGLDSDFRPEGLPLNRERYGLPEGVPYLLSVGTVRPRKDPLVLIRAFANLVQQGHHDLHLLMCGDLRMDEESLRAPLRGTSAQDRLHLPGYAAREDLPDLYREAEIVVLPSKLEGFGLPALEAMACGRPLVISEDPALLEVTGEAAVSFPTGDPDALGDVLDTLRADETLRNRLMAKARVQAAQFSWESCALGHAAVYRELL